MKKTTLMAFLLALLVPTMSAWVGGGGSTTYYAALKASVSSSGGGKVYAGTSNSAPAASSYKADSSTSSNQSSTTQNESKNFYAFASANEGYEFSHWSTSDDGTSVSTANPYAVSVKCSKSTESDPTLTMVYAVFKKKTLAAFDITFATSDAGTYTVDGSVPANKTGLTEATSVILKSTDPNFLSWNVGGTTVSDNPHTATCLTDTTISANFLTADQVTTATTYEELTAALANAQYVKITIPSGKEITVAKGATLTVPSGKQLVVDGKLVVVGAVANSGVITGNGTLYKVSYLIDQGELQVVYQADGTECVKISGTTYHSGESAHYYKTKVISCTPSVDGTVNMTSKWGVLLDGTTAYEISAQSVKGVQVSLDTTVAANKITAIIGSLTTTNISSGETSGKKNWVLFADCSLKGPVRPDATTRLNFNGTIDLCGHKLTFGQPRTYSDFFGVYLNGVIDFQPTTDCQNGGEIFFNCSSVTIKNIKGTPNMTFYDCGTEDSPATLTFGYQSGAHRKARFFGGCYRYTFTSANDSSYSSVYGGSYTSDPSDYLSDIDKLEVKYNSSSKYYVVQEKKEVTNVAVIGETPYETLAAAVDAAVSGDTISLTEAVDLVGETLEISAEKSIAIALDKHTVSGGKIVNRGTLVLTDSGTGIGGAVTDASGATVASDIENHGVLDIIFGTYSGAIDNKAGTLTTHNGIFSGTLTKSGGTVNLKGGHFTADVTALATVDGCDVTTKGGKYTVCFVPDGTMRDTAVSGSAGYGAKPYSDSDYALLEGWVDGKSSRTDYSAADWQRLAELLCFYQVFNNKGMDPTLVFDREVKTDSLNLNTNPNSGGLAKIKFDVAAGTPYRALTETVMSYGYYAKTYNALFSDNISSVAVAISDKSGNNKGTVCKAMIELWEGVRAPDYSSTRRMITNTVYEVGYKLFTINAGSNLAMIRPAEGAATFYATLGAAMDAAADGGTVMLANDCTEGLALNKAGTYTFDTMGFAASDEVSVADGLFVKSTASVDSSAKVLVADAKATTYVVAQKVAGVGAQFYDNLAEAVAAASGAAVTLYAATDETITLAAEGQSFTLNKNGIAFDDAKVVTTIANGSVTKSVTDAGTVYTVVTSVVDASDGNKYTSVGAAVATAEGNDVAVTVTANITEEVALPQGKALTVKIAEGVEANVTVTPAEGAFLVESAVEGGTKYESKRITETYSGEEAALSGNGAIVRADNAASAELKEIAVTLVSTEKTGGAIRKATFEVTPKDANGEAMGGELSGSYVFRLPVDAAATQLSAVVYHGEAQFGVYGVQSWDGAKFIEVESSSFSPYAYELLDGETANPVAAIGTTGYATLADAIAAVPTDGTETTITMIAGETLASSVTFPANTKIVLDLNGQTIDNQTTGFAFASGTSPARFTFIVNGDLTVKDSATGGNISIAKANNATTKAFYVNGMLTVDGGAISADYSAAYVNANGEMIVNGGVVHGDSYGININKSNGHVTINGGSVTASGEATLCTNGNEGIANLGVYDINAGTIENTGAGAAIYNPNRGTTINIHAPAVITGGTGIVMKGGTLNVDGGTISGTGAFAAPSAVNSGFTTTGDALYVEDTYSTGGINFKPTVNITGGTFNSANGYAAQYYTQATAVTESQANGSINISGNPTLTSAKQTDTAASTEIPGKINIAGGSFTHAVPEEYCADGYIPAAQDTNTGLYSVKTGSYVAQVGTAKYETLEAAIAAANDGDTIEMLADDNVSLTGGARLTIDKSLTITGPVDTNGEPLYTIYGTPAQTGTNNIYIDGSGTVTLSNLKIKDFGNNKGTDGAHAPVYVASSFTGTVNLDNLYISDFNRGGVFLYGGTFNVTDCYIDCANSRSDAFTKGIEIKGAATGTIKDTVIVNMERSNATYSTAGIEVYGNGTITVDGCTILSDVDPHQSVKGTYGIVSSRVGDHDPSGGSLHVTDCYIDVSNAALSVADDDEYGPVNNYSIVVDGEDTYFSNYIATWSAGSSITVAEGEFSEDVYADAGTITITGGTFNNFLPDVVTGKISISGGIFDKEVPEEYCAEGYIPAVYDAETGLYTVKQGEYVAQIVRGGEVIAKYEAFDAALADAQDGDTVQLLADVDMTSSFASASARFPISKSLTIDGQNHSITVGGRGFGVGMNASSKNDVTFKDVTIANSSAGARCIDTRGNLNSLTLDHVTLDTNGASGYTQPLTIGGNQSDKATVSIVNGSKIQTNDEGTAYYAIITFNPVNMTIEDSTIKGWACIYAKGPDGSAGSAGSVFTITDSELVSKNVYSGESNAFSMLMAEDDNVTFNVTNTKIDVNATGDQHQAIVGTSSSQTDVTANLGEGNEVTLSGEATFESNTGSAVVSGGTFNVAVPEEACAEGYIPAAQDPATGKYGVKQGAYVAQIVRNDEVVAKYETLAAAVTAANDGDTVQLLADVDMTDYFTTSSTRFPISKSLAIDGQGHSITVGGRGFGVGMNASSKVDVTFRDVTIENSFASGRCVDTRGNLNSLTLDNAKLLAPGAATQPLTIGGNQATAATVAIKNGSVVQTKDDGSSGYAIITFNPVNMTIEDSTIKGWACIYAKGPDGSAGSAGSVFTITDSELVSKNVYSGESNAFSMLTAEDDNVTFNITDTKIDVNATGDQPQAIVATSGSQTDVAANLGEGNEVTLSGNATFESNTGSAVVSGGTFNVAVPEEVCADGYIPAEQDPETGLYTVRTGTYVAQIVRNGSVVAKYESFDTALADALSGDTVQLLADVTGVTTTYNIDKAVTIDGQGQYKIVAGENTTPRNIFEAWGGGRAMFALTSSTANVTFKNLTIDNGEGHYYTYLVHVKSGSTATFTDVELLRGAEADASGEAGVGYGAAILADGGNVLVSGSFYADTHGEALEEGETGDRAAGIFPFTAILYQGGGIHFDDGVVAEIGQDLLLVGMQRDLDLSDAATKAEVQGMLDAMNVPSGYVPYTLKVADNAQFTFTGASPLGWNNIIDYGKDIMDVSSSLGFEMDKTTTPVEVGLIADTVLPDEFTYEDSNFTVNGNGNALSGTIVYTDDAGTMENVVMGTEEKPLVLDMTGLGDGKSINLGAGVSADNVTIKVTEHQAASMGQTIITWNTEGESEDDAASFETINVTVVDSDGAPVTDPATGEAKVASVMWDAELGIGYIGPCEARLTGPTHDKPVYTSLANAIALAAQSGDTVTLLMDIVNFSGTQKIAKSLTLDGAGHKITAAPVAEHRNIIAAWAGGTSMFKLESGTITFCNITLDGDATHAYTYLVSADNSTCSLTTENITLLHGGEIAGDANGAALQDGAGYGAAIHLNNGASLTVKDGFYADTHGAPATAGQTIGKADGVFPFTGILPEGSGTSVKFELTEDSDANPTVAIGEDLLLVGMIGVIPHDQMQEVLDYMKVPTRFIPYTLTLADGSAYAFTGASPRTWNDIIDYGKDIMDVSTAIGYQGLDKEETPVEVGLLTDTELPDTFTYEDANFSVNGNGNALSGTIVFKDDADGGMLRDIALGADGKPLVIDLTQTTNAVDLGAGVTISEIAVKMTDEQARAGTVVFNWNAEEVTGEDIPQHGTVSVTVVDDQGGATGDTKSLIWDEEYGIAYIGPVEARLTGATHETPIYTTLVDALVRALDGDTVKLFTDAKLEQVQDVGVDVTLDLAGLSIAVTGDAGILVTNATLSITNTVINATAAITGTIKAGTEATPASLVKSGEGGVVRIPMGIFAAAEGQKVLEVADGGTFEVSGGYFSVAVLPEYCAAGYAPADAEAGAPQPFTVAEAVEPFVYPIEGTAGVPITNKVWLANQFPFIYPDATKPVYASITNDLVAALSENGANGLPKWQDYVLGLDPRDPNAQLRLTASSKDASTVTISAAIDTTKFPAIPNVTVTFRLAVQNGNEWTTVEGCTGSVTPAFDRPLDGVVGKVLRIFADIEVR